MDLESSRIRLHRNIGRFKYSVVAVLSALKEDGRHYETTRPRADLYVSVRTI
jgi:hypothetical protein